ncbi:glucose-6-phosphate isomerase [candidate division KSB1 bacterium]|nr:glucose-6-phosphate isomerase [candidate division KSB1 bacterium]RQW05238.1 MAG: glucose-6-phosphate isomerase [candidate division KSB1 bacterium]
MSQSALSLDIALLKKYIVDADLEAQQTRVTTAHSRLMNKTCMGHDFLGWIHLPWRIESELDRIQNIAAEIQDNADHLIIIGIGGSYLGARAAIEFLADPFLRNDKVLYFGHHLGSDYTASFLDYVMQKNVYINVISKSGTTTEPAVSFRLLRHMLSGKYSQDELARRIITTTDVSSGILREMTNSANYRSFAIQDDIGGRFSVLSPVGLLPIAVAGFDIEAIVAGARDMAQACANESGILENDALKYAAARYALYQKGKCVEVFSTFEPGAYFIAEWWKQLFGESEGKEHKGIFPTSATLTTDLHSLGQFMQEGSRILFETFLTIGKSRFDIVIPTINSDADKLNFVAGQTVEFVNQQAYVGTKYAHFDGDLPNMTVELSERNEYALGQLFYFFEFAVAISGLLLGINPFNQPGVEAYKQNMFALLGKDGYEERKSVLDKQINGE